MEDHSHLKRLRSVWLDNPVYFVTTCVAQRRPILANSASHEIIRSEFTDMHSRHGWYIGRYVVMPDHVHFFARPTEASAKPMSLAVGKWKEWTAKRIVRELGIRAPIWQKEFFDHLLRSRESRTKKWDYMIQNPVRAGLVNSAEDWSFTGTVDFG